MAILWPALLLLLGLTLVMAEIFLPTGGVLGFISFTAIVVAIVLAFVQGGSTTGLIFLSVSCLAVPVAIAAAFRFLPDTPMGRRLLASIPTAEEVLPDSEERRRLRDMVGKVGRAKSKMLPSGAVDVEGHVVDAVSQGGPIEIGQSIRVIEVHGNMVVVQPVDELHAAERSQDDMLSQPIESLGIDPFDDPLT